MLDGWSQNKTGTKVKKQNYKITLQLEKNNFWSNNALLCQKEQKKNWN